MQNIFLYLRHRLQRMKKEETIDYNIKTVWHGIARMYNQQATKYNGTMSIGFALLNIHSEEGTPATKIGPMMGLEARSVTRLLSSMEEKGLIYRQADKVDKRSVLIFLTKAGKLNKEKSRETVLRFNEVVREEIPNKKLDVFFEVLQEINKMIERNNIYETANS
jgi:MarR family transcriptional regulator, organic hydroperoxide resistance regulator